MSDFATHPEDVPVADWAEQQEDADPVRDEEAAALAGRPVFRDPEADEADVAEQSIAVFYPDEE